MKKLIPLLLLFVSLVSFSQSEMPRIDLSTVDGTTVSSKDLSKDDKVVVVSLWATWCVPCLKELDAISEIYADWQAET
ncbi:MAG: TlpA disulfide reductase family protein, partial [Aequorivita vladivostokensis]|nr:TlpA disulfide reductase family protein [Aequorivita vladivostokensis]